MEQPIVVDLRNALYRFVNEFMESHINNNKIYFVASQRKQNNNNSRAFNAFILD